MPPAFVVSTIGNDPTNTFLQFLIAYGGQNIVTTDGKFHGRDPQIKEAVVKALDRLSKLYKDGYIPPSSINWNDADDNNAFHSKLCVMDFDGTLSTELAMLRKQKDEYNDVITRAPPLTNDGKPMASQFGVNSMIIPKGAKNIEVGKEFAKYLIQPEVNGKYLKGGLGRWLPIFPELVKNDPWWTDPKRDPHVPPYVEQGFGGADDAGLLHLQSGLGAGAQRAPVQRRLPRHRRRRHDAGGGSRQGDQALRRDLREIRDQGLRGTHGGRIVSDPQVLPGAAVRRGDPAAATSGAAICRVRNMPGRWPSSCPMSSCF